MMACGCVSPVMLLFFLPFLIPPALAILLPAVAFFLPPPKQRPDGRLYWTSLSLLSITLAGLALFGTSLPWQLRVLVVPAILALLANTAWARGATRNLRENLEDEDLREALRSLSRRLWFPLQFLSLILFLGVWQPWVG